MIERSRVRIPAGAAGECSSPGSTVCADSYFGIRCTLVLQLNTRTPYVGGWHEVTWCMVVWCTQNLRRDGSSSMWHQPCQRCKYTTSVDIQKRAIKSYLFIHVESQASAVSLLECGELHYIKSIYDHQQQPQEK